VAGLKKTRHSRLQPGSHAHPRAQRPVKGKTVRVSQKIPLTGADMSRTRHQISAKHKEQLVKELKIVKNKFQ